MLKFIGGTLFGVFAGALVMEILRRRRPVFARFIERRASAVADGLLDETEGVYLDGQAG